MSTVSDPAENADLELGQYDDFIDDRLSRTSFHLKTLDLVTGLIVLGLFLCGSLLLLVLVDHWIVGLGVAARLVSLIVIGLVSLFLLIRQVLIPLVRAINPEYAALTVEQAHPELKNGLINFLFFRERSSELRKGIYTGMQQQAASDLTTVPIDSAIDRSMIIRLGYGLIAVVAIWVAYILLSPKNPLQTLQRIAMPLQDIARPSQVDIVEVLPGSVEVYRGEAVDVRVRVEGLDSEELPRLLFSTLDGQIIERPITLAREDNTRRYAGVLATSDGGVQHDLEYRIAAGDAISERYEVRVAEAPHILVERLKLDYPDYTGQPDEVIQSEGDIRAIEGTRVTVVGKANQPIKRGRIVFADASSTAPKRSALKIRGETQTEAYAQFSLRMNADRDGGLYRGYHLQFVNEADQSSVEPIQHSIDVTPDLRPVVQILTPEQRTLELPENSWQKIEVRAVDPDFKLTRVQLVARTRGRKLFKENLLATTRATEWHAGQFTATFRFVPRDYGLRDGDVVEYLALAEDNRHALDQTRLDPNHTFTARQYIRIVKADPFAEEPQDGEAGNQETQEQPQPQENEDGSDSGSEKGSEKQESGESKQDSVGKGDSQQQQPGDQGSSAESQENQEQQEGESGQESGLQQNSEGGSEAQESQSEGGSPGDSSESDSDQQSDGEAAGNNAADRSGDNSSDSDNPQQAAEPGSESNGSDPASSENGASSPNGVTDPQSADANEDADGEAGSDEPLPSSGERDGDVVERIREHMKDKGDLEQYEEKQEQQEASGESGDTENGSEGSESPESNQDGSEQNPSSTDTGGSQDTAGDSESGAGSQDDQNASSKSGDESGDGKSTADGKKPDSAGDGSSAQSESPRGDGESNGTKGSEGAEKRTADGQEGDSSSDGTGDATGENKSDANGQESESDSGESDSGESDSGELDSGESSDSQAGTDGPEGSSDPSEPEPGEESGTAGTDDAATADDNADGKPSESEAGSKGNEGSQGNESRDSQKQDGEDMSSQNSSDANSSNVDSQPSDTSQSETSSDQGKQTSSKPSTKMGQPKGDSGNGEAGVDDTDPNAAASGDDANLEYARKATDLVLEYLKDQEQNPDQELLDKLGWDQGDVDKFIRRWDEMKRNAKGSDSTSRQNKTKLDELLKGMGLQSPETRLRRSQERNDQQRDNRNTGRKRKVPAELLNPFRAFQRGIQRAE